VEFAINSEIGRFRGLVKVRPGALPLKFLKDLRNRKVELAPTFLVEQINCLLIENFGLAKEKRNLKGFNFTLPDVEHGVINSFLLVKPS